MSPHKALSLIVPKPMSIDFAIRSIDIVKSVAGQKYRVHTLLMGVTGCRKVA